DVILGLASNGLHSNGFSLVRKIVADGSFDLMAENDDLNTTLASALLAPTRIYVKPILNLIRDFSLNGIVHITGGGFEGNLPRIIPSGVRARIDTAAWPWPKIFGWLRKQGEISREEMLRVFNCGLGMVLIVPREDADDILDRLRALGERGYRIGQIERKQADEPTLELFDGGERQDTD
ncbi:unnamed protein product, partial [marine sediment metagenome]